jgi:predicted GTPase
MILNSFKIFFGFTKERIHFSYNYYLKRRIKNKLLKFISSQLKEDLKKWNDFLNMICY